MIVRGLTRRPSPGMARPVIQSLGSLHPVAVHFPVALVVTAAIAEVVRARGAIQGGVERRSFSVDFARAKW